MRGTIIIIPIFSMFPGIACHRSVTVNGRSPPPRPPSSFGAGRAYHGAGADDGSARVAIIMEGFLSLRQGSPLGTMHHLDATIIASTACSA